MLESVPIQLTGENGGVLELMGGVNCDGDMKLLESWLWTNRFGLVQWLWFVILKQSSVMYFPYSCVFSASSLQNSKKDLWSFSSIIIFVTLTLANLLTLGGNLLIGWRCERAKLFSCGLATNFFVLVSLTTLFISTCVNSVFPFSNVFRKMFAFTFLFVEEASLYSISSPTSFLLLNSSIFLSTNDASREPEQTALIPPFVSDKTGFTVINHPGSSFPTNPEPFFFESEICLHCCFMFYFVCNRLWSTLMGQDHLYFYGIQHFLIETALLSSLLSFQQQLHRKPPFLRFFLTLFVLTFIWSCLLGQPEFHKRDWFRLLSSFLDIFSSALTFFKLIP